METNGIVPLKDLVSGLVDRDGREISTTFRCQNNSFEFCFSPNFEMELSAQGADGVNLPIPIPKESRLCFRLKGQSEASVFSSACSWLADSFCLIEGEPIRGLVGSQAGAVKNSPEVWADDDVQGLRSARLVRFLSFVEKEGKRCAIDCFSKIARVEDHKGTLSVMWHLIPTGQDVTLVEIGWEEVGEDSRNIRHWMA